MDLFLTFFIIASVALTCCTTSTTKFLTIMHWKKQKLCKRPFLNFIYMTQLQSHKLCGGSVRSVALWSREAICGYGRICLLKLPKNDHVTTFPTTFLGRQLQTAYSVTAAP